MKDKILAHAKVIDTDLLIDTLLSLGIYEKLTIKDRESWIGRGEILDSSGGQLLFSMLKDIGCEFK